MRLFHSITAPVQITSPGSTGNHPVQSIQTINTSGIRLVFIKSGGARSGLMGLRIGAPGGRKEQPTEFPQATSWR
jgi:hypothetical protein